MNNPYLAIAILKRCREEIAALSEMFDNRERYVAQSAATRDGLRAELPERVMAPLLGNDWEAA